MTKKVWSFLFLYTQLALIKIPVLVTMTIAQREFSQVPGTSLTFIYIFIIIYEVFAPWLNGVKVWICVQSHTLVSELKTLTSKALFCILASDTILLLLLHICIVLIHWTFFEHFAQCRLLCARDKNWIGIVSFHSARIHYLEEAQMQTGYKTITTGRKKHI